MRHDRWFKFADVQLNRKLIALLERAGLACAISNDGKVRYHSSDEEQFEDVLACIRGEVFPSWQVLSFPPDWANKYRHAMEIRQHPYQEELNNGSVEFLIAGDLRPHSWKID
jgi:hypothetical protein